MSCQQTQQLLEQAFVQGQPAPLEQAQDHLQACAECREFHHRLFSAAAALEQGPEQEAAPALSTSERDLLRAMVLPPEPRRRTWPRLRVAVATLVTTAAAGLLVLALQGPRSPHQHRFQARGQGPMAAAKAPVGVRAMCLHQAAAGVQVRSLVNGAGCTVRDALGLTYRNETQHSWHLRLLLARPGGAARQLLPAAGGDAALDPASDEQVLPGTVALDQLGAGRAQLLAVFSRRPMDGEALLRAASQASPVQPLLRAGAARVVQLVVEVGQ